MQPVLGEIRSVLLNYESRANNARRLIRASASAAAAAAAGFRAPLRDQKPTSADQPTTTGSYPNPAVGENYDEPESEPLRRQVVTSTSTSTVRASGQVDESEVRPPYGTFEQFKVECFSYDIYSYETTREDARTAVMLMDEQVNFNFNFTSLPANCGANANGSAYFLMNAHNSSTGQLVSSIEAGFQVWALALFVLSLVTAFGNVLVVLSVIREKSLQTVTNYFIISLAVADIMVGICAMPFEIYVELWSGIWTLPVVACDAYIATDVMSSTASILNLAAISIDRYVAVTQPIKYAQQRNQTRVFGMIAISWLISIGVALPVVFGVNEVPNRNPSDCQFNNPDFILYSSLCSFYIPCVIILGLYWRIFIEIRRRTKTKEHSNSHSQSYSMENRKTSKRLLNSNEKREKKAKKAEKKKENKKSVKQNDKKPTLPRISYSETERNSGDTNDASDEHTPLESDTYVSSLSDAAGKKLLSSDRPVQISCMNQNQNQSNFRPSSIETSGRALLQDNSVSEMSSASNFLRGSSMRTDASQAASLDLFENAFTDMDYVDEIDMRPHFATNGRHFSLSPPAHTHERERTVTNKSLEIGTCAQSSLHHIAVTGEIDRSPAVLTNHCAILLENNATATPGVASKTLAAAAHHCTNNNNSSNNNNNNNNSNSKNHTCGYNNSAGNPASGNLLAVPLRVVQPSHDEEVDSEKLSTPVPASTPTSPTAKPERSKIFNLSRKKSDNRRDRNISRERKVTKTMIIVLACFFACWMPFFCLNLLSAFCMKFQLTSDICSIPRDLFVTLTWLGYINSTLNPLIYCWQNREFRKAFHRLLTCAGPASSRRRR